MESILYQRIKGLCKERGVTLTELAKTVGVSDTVFRSWKESSPSIDKVRRIADYFKVSVDYLIGNSDIQDVTDKIISDKDIISLQRAHSKITKEEEPMWEMAMKMLRRTFDHAFSDE